MAYPIKQTKIIQPRKQHDFLSRRRLLGMLGDLLDYRLTLIAAPAGYGKTSLLVDLAHQVEYPVCWLALDPLDYDPTRFINYFVAAIQNQFPDFGAASRSLLENQELNDLNTEQILQTIINDLYEHVQEHFAFVLDDFHLIESSPDINYFINHFIQEMDENCHLVIATRSLLSLPDLPLMVGRSQVQGLSFEELAFLPEELKDLYLLKYQQTISDQETKQIVDESEGWITGLLLTAETTQLGLTDQGRAAKAAGIDLYDYLARQVLDQQTPEMQDFLLRTSMLEEFNEELCQQALGDPTGEFSWSDLINQLLHKNLFIQPVDNGGTWLRYHHLFRDFLQQYFQTQSPDQAHGLLQKMVVIYREQGWYEKAYAACNLVGEDQMLVDYLDSVSPHLLHSGQLSLFKNWLEDLSPALLEENPRLVLHLASIASFIGDAESGLRMLNRVMEGQNRIEDPELIALVFIRRATCHRLLGSFQSGLDDALRALELSKGLVKEEFIEAEAEREIGLNQQGLGLNHEAKEHLERSLISYLHQNDQRNAAIVQIGLGFMEMNKGEYQAARTLYQQAYQFWKELGNLNRLVGLCNNLGVLDHLTGDYLEAFSWFSKALEYARQSSNLRESAFTMASLGDLALDLGVLSRAEDYFNQSFVIAEEIGDSYLKIYLQLSLAALARRKGDLITARRYLETVDYQIREYPSADEKARYHLESGQLLLDEDKLDTAREEFQAALEIFSKNNLPVETSLTLMQLAGINWLQGDYAETDLGLESIQEITRSLGTIDPLVPTIAVQEELLICLKDHRPDDRFTKDLSLAVNDFRSRLPGLLEALAFNIPLVDSSQQPFLDITAMGRVSLKSRGELVSVPEWTKQKTVRELFFYLLSYPEGASRDEICLEFWPDSKPEQLKKQFKNALYKLRRAVGTDTILYHQATRLYHFNRHLDYCYDVEEFYKILDQADAESNPDRKFQMLRQAADLYKHPFAPTLEGIWSEPVRYRLHLDYERIMLLLAEQQFDKGNHKSALETIEELLVAVPDQEAAWRLAMRSYALLGDRSGVERMYQRCCQTLGQDLDVEPSEETYALYQELMS